MTKLFAILALLLVLGTSISLNEDHEGCGGRRPYTRWLKLTFNYAARQRVALCSSTFSVEWNGKTVFYVVPKDYRVHSVSKWVRARVGSNLIDFIAEGKSDGVGVTLDNIELIRTFSRNDKEYFIENGGFEKGHSLGKGWKVFSGNFKGWEECKVEVGYGKTYNNNWKVGTHVAELD